MSFSSLFEVHQTPFFLFFTDPKQDTTTLFVWLIRHHPSVFFSHNKSTISNQPSVFFTQNKLAPATG
jgi:hypothetical protein